FSQESNFRMADNTGVGRLCATLRRQSGAFHGRSVGASPRNSFGGLLRAVRTSEAARFAAVGTRYRSRFESAKEGCVSRHAVKSHPGRGARSTPCVTFTDAVAAASFSRAGGSDMSHSGHDLVPVPDDDLRGVPRPG